MTFAILVVVVLRVRIRIRIRRVGRRGVAVSELALEGASPATAAVFSESDGVGTRLLRAMARDTLR